MSAKSSTPNPTSNPSLSETQSNNRGCSTSRKRQLSKASDEEMKPPASRPRSQSQTRKTDEWRNYFQDTRSVIQHDKSDRIYTDETKYSTQYNSNYSQRNKSTTKIRPKIDYYKNAVSEAIENAAKPLKRYIGQKIIKLFDRTHTLKTENETLQKKMEEKESKLSYCLKTKN